MNIVVDLDLMSIKQSIIALPFIVAFILTWILTPYVRWIAFRTGWVDKPNFRKLHREPMPMLGGVAIYCGVVLSIRCFAWEWSSELLATVAGATLLFGVGVYDDRKPLPCSFKLLIQLCVAILLYISGVRILPNDAPGWLSISLSVLWVVGITNATNLLDNMDGLAAGVSAVASGFLVMLGVMHDKILPASVAAAMMGGCLGFLPWNWKPARIYMGDAGSLFLGLVLSVISMEILVPDHASFVGCLAPLFVLGVPIFDTALVVVSRLRRRLNPLTTPGKDHTSHRLVELGLTQRAAVLVLYTFGALLGVTALIIAQMPPMAGTLAALIVTGLGLLSLWQLEWRRKAVASQGCETDFL